MCFMTFILSCIVEQQLENKPCFIYKEWCLVLCDFQVLNYLPKITLPSSKFDKVLFCLFYRWPRSKINKTFKYKLILMVAGRVINKI